MISTSRQKSTEVTVTDVPRGALSPRQTAVIRQSLRNTVRLKCPGATLEIPIRVFSLNIEGAEFSEKHNATLEVSRGKPSDYAYWLSKVVKVIVHSGEKVFSWPDIQWSESINSRDQGIYLILENDRIQVSRVEENPASRKHKFCGEMISMTNKRIYFI